MRIGNGFTIGTLAGPGARELATHSPQARKRTQADRLGPVFPG